MGEKAEYGQSGDETLIRLIRILLSALLSQIGVDCGLGFEGTDFAELRFSSPSAYPHVASPKTSTHERVRLAAETFSSAAVQWSNQL